MYQNITKIVLNLQKIRVQCVDKVLKEQDRVFGRNFYQNFRIQEEKTLAQSILLFWWMNDAVGWGFKLNRL